MAPLTEHSLFRNGRVLTRRDPDGSDAGRIGMELETYNMPVQDARNLRVSNQRNLKQNGFELFEHELTKPKLDFLDHDQVVRNYYPDCVELVREISKARLVVAFDHNVRSASGKKIKQRIKGGQEIQGPAHIVHGDYTLTSAPQRLMDLTKPPSINDTVKTLLNKGESLLDSNQVSEIISAGRFSIINVWRNIAQEPVQTNPLALCDATTVHPNDLVVFEIHYNDRVGENYFSKHNDSHQWYFYPNMTYSEALLIKQWDSQGTLAQSNGKVSDFAESNEPCTFSFHSSFEDPKTPLNAPDRWSIEVRCAAIYN